MSAENFKVILDLAEVPLLSDLEEVTSEEPSNWMLYLICTEKMQPEEWCFLKYLQSNQTERISDDARCRITNYAACESICADLEEFSAGSGLTVIRTSTVTNLCNICRIDEERKIIIEPGLSPTNVYAIIRQQRSYCRNCKRQLYAIISNDYYYIDRL